ncbi:type II toxin-antitoxin system HicB family antitoxin [Oceanidesulfovibrio marinus]|uniref:HicB-like antitoxin of toxin-antitoxin system domain-containing protein n=1 Tax=Oceanidesulfovibrio marinus TaxID=370038 RepID=A0A6P1ZDJ8_9BACT|nr:type II toxin-antitoxin system HicB family antitoxin [Oceanidesulfovibrio marinus]TVM32123.1 hypothetical protein DQK91_16470 [Oceanidesulfovibrio marinus]
MNAPKETYRVTFSGRKWVVERDGCADPLGSFRTKRDALRHILRVANDASAKVHIVDERKTKVPAKTATYIAILEKDEGSDYGVWFPDFPGCVTAGSTLDEVKDMAADALTSHIEWMHRDGDSIPVPSTLDAVMEDPFASLGVPFLVIVPAPPAKSNRITVTLPATRVQAVNERAKEPGGSRSGTTTPDPKPQAQPMPDVETIALPAEGFVRLKQVLAVIPVSRSGWYRGIREGRFPAPYQIPGTRTSMWRVEEIRALISRVQEGA